MNPISSELFTLIRSGEGDFYLVASLTGLRCSVMPDLDSGVFQRVDSLGRGLAIRSENTRQVVIFRISEVDEEDGHSRWILTPAPAHRNRTSEIKRVVVLDS